MTHQFTVGETVRHRDNARTATIRRYVDINMYEIQYDDHHTWATVSGDKIAPYSAPIYSATAADAMMGTTVGAPAAGISVPIGQCIELINAAVAYRDTERNYQAARDSEELEDDEIAAATATYSEAADHLHAVIEALPEQEN